MPTENQYKLESIRPREAVEMYLNHRSDDLAETTLHAYESRLSFFTAWCDDRGVDDMNDLTGRLLYKFRIDRRDDGDLSKTSLKTQLTCIRSFIKFCESIEAVPEGLHRDVILPSLKHGDDVREVAVSIDEAEQIRSYLRTYEYATLRHVLFEVLWSTGIRTGTAHSLDVDDVLQDENALRIRHRSDTDTRLKNGTRAERLVALDPTVVDIIADYIQTNRPETTDDYGRNPLFASEQGRMHKSNLRKLTYAITRPCYYAGECPHSRDTDDCEAVAYSDAHGCPSSKSLHAIRRGSITKHLIDDVPKTVVSDRANVSPDVLDKHYDVRDEKTRMEQRRDVLFGDE